MSKSQKWPESVIVYTDGACRGNPGPSSTGISFIDSAGGVVFETAELLGSQTNNYAEYMAVVQALTLAITAKVKEITLRSDSELLIKQLKGEYKVKAEGLKPLYLEVKKLLSQFDTVKLEHVRREFNKRADELANLKLDGLI